MVYVLTMGWSQGRLRVHGKCWRHRQRSGRVGAHISRTYISSDNRSDNLVAGFFGGGFFGGGFFGDA